MRADKSWAGALAPVLMLMVLLPTSGAAGAGTGDYAPENIDKTYKYLSWLCMVPAFCPVTEPVYDVIKRAMAGDASSEYLLGLTLLTGDGLPSDRRAGLVWTARAAEDGDPDAARDVAARMRNGEAIDVDETKIAAALKPKAEANDAEAMRALGPMYIRGRGVTQDPAFGLDLMKRAVEKGSSGAANDLSELYLRGAPGVPESRSEALRWLGVSANRGNVDAMVKLGYMSMNGPPNGRSNERYLAEGFCWLMRAALLDEPQAQEKLSMMFAGGEKDDHGTVIPVDLIQADLWFRLAARSPYHDNSQIRAMIEPHMTTAQLGEAKRLVELWQPRKFEELKAMTIATPASPGAPHNCAMMTN
jgi:TPR repeat protein